MLHGIKSSARSQRRAAALSHPPRDFSRKLSQRENSIGFSRRLHEPRHAPHHRRCFVLHNHFTARSVDPLRAQHPVRAHSRHHHGLHSSAIGPRHRSKQHIHCRPTGVLRSILVQFQSPLIRHSRHRHVVVSRRDPCFPRF